MCCCENQFVLKRVEVEAGGAIFARTRLMLGEVTMDAIASAKVAVFGLGGVGGWCAESLVRTGVRRLTLVDPDLVCASNINRQLMATSSTVGRPKAEALAERLREINPDFVPDVRLLFYDASTAGEFDFSGFDYVVDAIDSLDSKVLLIRNALASPGTTLFSSMGAALRSDPFQVRRDEFRKVAGDGLARALRRRFRESGGIPDRRFTCVWSPERREAAVRLAPDEPRVNGSLVHTTAVFGFALASLVVEDVERKAISDCRLRTRCASTSF